MNEYMTEKLGADAAIAAAAEDMASASAVVSASLDLGLVHLRRARETADADVRRTELEAAEQSFVAIRGQAGDTADYKLFLGQVYHWLGRTEEGDRLFEELLAADRRPELLVEVAAALREVGAENRARALAEEAWRSAEAPAVRHQAAQLRALASLDLDDEVTWLERCDKGQPLVRAMLATAQGRRAQRSGRDDDAAQHYRTAISTYESMPESGPILNNRALVYLSLYECTGDVADFRKGVEGMRAALRLQPGSGVAVGNSASLLIEEAVLETIDGVLDLKRLRFRGGVDNLSYLSSDAASARAVARKFGEHPGLREARRQIDLAQQLMPHATLAPELAIAVYETTRDGPAVRALAERVAKGEFDFAAAARNAQERYRGQDLEQARESRASVLADMERTAAALEDEPANRTFQAAAAVWTAWAVDALEDGEPPAIGGKPVDAASVTRWIEMAHAAAPTAATYRALAGALLSRAAMALAGRDAGFAAMWNETRRAAGASHLVPYAFGRPGPWRDGLKADPDVARAAELIAAHVTRFPDDVAPRDWALLRMTRPADAKAVRERIASDEVQRLLWETRIRLAPYRGDRAFNVHWLRLALGDEAGARLALADCRALGTPLPAD